MSVENAAAERPLAASRRVVWIGFACILLVMVVMAFDAARSVQRAAAGNAALMRSFRHRDQILDELRNITVRSGATIRDYLTEPDDAKAEAARSELQASRQQAEQLLNAYSAAKDGPGPGESQTLGDLKSGVAAYWQSLEPVLQWDAATRQKRGESYRQQAIVPLRSEVLRLSREITRLNDQQLDAGEEAIQNQQSNLRARLIIASAIGVGIGCILALFVALRIRTLEAVAESQYSKVTQARHELRELAGRLETAQEEERRRLSRELHDEVGQSMSAMLVELSRLEAVIPRDEKVSERLASFRKQAETSVRSVRDMALLLRPSMLDDLGLVAALNWQGREVARRTGLRVRVDAEDTGDTLPDPQRTCIYRVVQEALNNCVKHARAASVRVLLKQSPEALDVTIEDDGIGFDPAREKGLGLLGMEERVTRLNGQLHLESTKGKGTTLSVHLPLPQPSAKQEKPA